MPFLYGGEEGNTDNDPCNRDEKGLPNAHHAEKEQQARQFVGFGMEKVFGMRCRI